MLLKTYFLITRLIISDCVHDCCDDSFTSLLRHILQLFPKSRKLGYDSRQQLSQIQNALICPSELFLSLDELSRYADLKRQRKKSIVTVTILLPRKRRLVNRHSKIPSTLNVTQPLDFSFASPRSDN